MAARRQFGSIDKLGSGRYRARYVGPDMERHAAPRTFDDREDAMLWLRKERALVEDPETWTPPAERAAAAQRRATFDRYAASWLAGRTLKPRTRAEYVRLLDHHLLPTFGARALASIVAADVLAWHGSPNLAATPTQRARAYGLLRTIMLDAERDRLIDHCPVPHPGRGQREAGEGHPPRDAGRAGEAGHGHA